MQPNVWRVSSNGSKRTIAWRPCYRISETETLNHFSNQQVIKIPQEQELQKMLLQ